MEGYPVYHPKNEGKESAVCGKTEDEFLEEDQLTVGPNGETVFTKELAARVIGENFKQENPYSF